MQLTGNLFAQLGAEMGHEISTLPDFPAEIRAPQGTIGGVSGFQVQLGAQVYTPGDKADVIVANILADIIILLLPDIPGKLKEGGLFFASGIIENYRKDVSEAAAKVGLRVKEVTRIKDWVGLLMEKAE